MEVEGQFAEIHDRDAGNCLAPDFSTLLALLEPEAKALQWAIHDLEGRGEIGTPRGHRDIEEAVGGLQVSWEELRQIAARLEDVWDAIVAGCATGGQMPRLPLNDPFFEACELVVVCFDSAFWKVYSRSESVLTRIERTFGDVRRTRSY
jgi:hypothetical protein